jgi:RNA polymerase sigma-70 factor (ECF subfamily)
VFEPVDTRPDPERLLASVQLRAAIQRAELVLSAQQKTIFRLRHYENLSLEEIARHLGLRAGTARAHLFRAIHKIRKELENWRARKPQGTNDENALQ